MEPILTRERILSERHGILGEMSRHRPIKSDPTYHRPPAHIEASQKDTPRLVDAGGRLADVLKLADRRRGALGRSKSD